MIRFAAPIASLALLARGLGGPPATEPRGDEKPPRAPDFSARAHDGRTYTMAGLTRDRPLVLVFVQGGCPCSSTLQAYLNSLHAAYGSRASFAGVFDGDADAARRWAEANGVRFPLIPDPGSAIVRRYGVESSAQVVLVGKGGSIDRRWAGYSPGGLRDLGHRLARRTGLDESPLDLSGLPDELHMGCPY